MQCRQSSSISLAFHCQNSHPPAQEHEYKEFSGWTRHKLGGSLFATSAFLAPGSPEESKVRSLLFSFFSPITTMFFSAPRKYLQSKSTYKVVIETMLISWPIWNRETLLAFEP